MTCKQKFNCPLFIAQALGIAAASFWSVAEKDRAESPAA